MTVRATPSFIQGNSHPAEETRLMLGGILGTTTGTFSGGVAAADPGHGVVLTGDLAVTANGTPNMSVNVATGNAWIRGTQSAAQGVYHLFNDATVNLAISAADPTNPRRDLIIAQVRDGNYSGSSYDGRILVVTGTPAASPSDPSLASYPNALVLARVAVAANASSIVAGNITDLRTLANARNKVPVFTTEANRGIAIPTATEGMMAYLTAPTVPAVSSSTASGLPSGILTAYNGSAWVCLTPVAARTDATGTTSSTTFTTSLGGTPGTNPSVTLSTGTSVLVSISVEMSSSNATPIYCWTAVGVSGASTINPVNALGVVNQAPNTAVYTSARTFVIDGLTAGTNTFTLQYKVGSGTGNFANRSITVQPIN